LLKRPATRARAVQLSAKAFWTATRRRALNASLSVTVPSRAVVRPANQPPRRSPDAFQPGSSAANAGVAARASSRAREPAAAEEGARRIIGFTGWGAVRVGRSMRAARRRGIDADQVSRGSGWRKGGGPQGPPPGYRGCIPCLEQRHHQQRDDVDDLDERVDRRAGGVLVGVADGVAGDGR